MTPSEAPVDAGLDTTDLSVSDVSTETVEVPVEGEPQVETQETAPPAQTAPYRAVSEDGKRLDEKARATLDELKAKDPMLASAFRKALFEADGFRRALPGGLKEVQELRSTIERFGGPAGIEDLQQKFQGWDEFDKQYMAGDPKALEFMLASPESQAAFQKIAPQAFDKYADINPEGYTAYICQRVVNDAFGAKIPIAAELVQSYLAMGDSAKAAEQFEKIRVWLDSLDTRANVKPKEAAPAQPQADQRYTQLEQEHSELVLQGWRNESGEILSQIYGRFLGEIAGTRKLTEAERIAINSEVQKNLDERTKSEKANVAQYVKAKDKDGYLKMSRAAGEKHLRDLILKAFNRYVGTKPGPKPQVAAPPNGAPVRPPVNGKPADVYTDAPMPSRDQIDWDSPFTKIREGKALTLDGKKVKWR